MQNIGIDLLKMLTACVCGGVIGIERTKRLKDAGIRTHCLIALASCVLMITSKYGFVNAPLDADAARIAAQIVSGIGFIGAGVIFRDGNSLKGLSTAAGMWMTAAAGMAIGCDQWLLGIVGTAFVLVIQELFHHVLIGSDAYSDKAVTILYRDNELIDRRLKDLENSGDIRIISKQISKQAAVRENRVRFLCRNSQHADDLFIELADYPETDTVTWE